MGAEGCKQFWREDFGVGLNGLETESGRIVCAKSARDKERPFESENM